jgi:hypothetical protein
VTRKDAAAPNATGKSPADNSSIGGVVAGMSAVLAGLAVVLGVERNRVSVGMTVALLLVMGGLILAMGALIGFQRHGRR